MLLTTIVAVILGVAQWLLPASEPTFSQFRHGWGQMVVMLIVMSINLVVVLPVLGMLFFVERWEADLFLLVIVVPIYSAFASVIEWIPLTALSGGDREGLLTLYCLNLTEFMIVIGSVAYLRLLGFRFACAEATIR